MGYYVLSYNLPEQAKADYEAFDELYNGTDKM
jgi:hypothetical protein